MVLQTVFERFVTVKNQINFTGLAALGAILYYLTVEFLVKNFLQSTP